MRTALAAFADVIAFHDLITILRFTFAVISVIQLLSVRTSEKVADFVIAEILNAVNILLVFARLTDFVVGGLDVGVLTVLLKICVIFLAGVTRVRYDVGVLSSGILSQPFQKRNQSD